MTDLVFLKHKQALTTSLKVAEVFGKRHNDVLRAIESAQDNLATWQLYEVEKLQFIARTIIAGLLAAGVDYHQPYQKCKAAFNAYAQLSYINERLLLARGLSD